MQLSAPTAKGYHQDAAKFLSPSSRSEMPILPLLVLCVRRVSHVFARAVSFSADDDF